MGRTNATINIQVIINYRSMQWLKVLKKYILLLLTYELFILMMGFKIVNPP